MIAVLNLDHEIQVSARGYGNSSRNWHKCLSIIRESNLFQVQFCAIAPILHRRSGGKHLRTWSSRAVFLWRQLHQVAKSLMLPISALCDVIAFISCKSILTTSRYCMIVQVDADYRQDENCRLNMKSYIQSKRCKLRAALHYVFKVTYHERLLNERSILISHSLSTII